MPSFFREEIQAEALVRNLPGFARFLPVAALVHGQVLNVAGLARHAGVARTTVAGYLDILADTHLAWPLPAFEGRLRVKERAIERSAPRTASTPCRCRPSSRRSSRARFGAA